MRVSTWQLSQGTGVQAAESAIGGAPGTGLLVEKQGGISEGKGGVYQWIHFSAMSFFFFFYCNPKLLRCCF